MESTSNQNLVANSNIAKGVTNLGDGKKLVAALPRQVGDATPTNISMFV